MRENQRYCGGVGSFVSCTLLVLLGVAPVDAATGDAPSTLPGVTTSDTGSQLEEVVVTATRREESIQRVPISINALTQNDLTEGGIKTIADIAAVTPGLQFDSPASPSTYNMITIRGLNSNVGGSVVGIYLDDTPIQVRLSPLGNVGNPYPVTFDLNRVEVARGPQGTLFGAGAEAGTVRFISNEPSLTEFSGISHAELSTTEGGTPSYELGVAAGGPIVQDKIGFRVSAWTRQDGGYVDRLDPISGNIVQRDSNEGYKSAFRGALTFLVADHVRITPSIYYQEARTSDNGRFLTALSDPSQGDFINPQEPEATQDRLWVPNLKVDAGLSFADLTSTSSYIRRRITEHLDGTILTCAIAGGCGNPLGIIYPGTAADRSVFLTGQGLVGVTEELRLTSNQSDKLVSWVTGIFYDHRNQEDYATIGPMPGTSINLQDGIQDVIDEQIAAYAQADFHFTKQLTVTLGERIAKVKSTTVVNSQTTIFAAAAVSNTTLRETPNTPKIALSYQANDNNLFYISAAKGFRMGGGNDVPLGTCPNFVGPATFDSDYVWSYEIGAKNTLFDNRLQVNSSVFHVNWSKIQQIVNLPCGALYTTNTGNAVSNGFDLSVQALVTDRARVGVNVGYDNAYFTENVKDSYGNPLVYAGDKLGLLPQVNAPWNVNLLMSYEIPILQDSKIVLWGEYQYNSRNPGPFITQIPNSTNYAPVVNADPATNRVNARIGYKRGTLDVSLFVDNALNSHPVLGEQAFPPTVPLITASTFRPRTVGLSATLGF